MNATKDLKDSHDVVSNKTNGELTKKRTREEECERIRTSDMFKEDSSHVCVLMETLRIILNNLPYMTGKYTESIMLNQLARKTDF